MDQGNTNKQVTKEEGYSSKDGVVPEYVLKSMDAAVSKHYLDESLTMIWANDAFYSLFGYAKEEVKLYFHSFKQYSMSRSCDFSTMLKTLHSAYRQGEKSVAYEMRMPINHNKSIWIKIMATFIEVVDNNTIVYMFYTNIHEEKIKQQEQLIKENINNFKWMLSEYGGNVYISDMETYDLLYVNKHSCDTLQTTEDTIIGRKCYEVIQGRTSPCPFCTNDRLRKDETYEWEFYNPALQRTFMIKNRMLDWFGHKARIELSYDMYSTEYKLAKKDLEREAILKTIPAGMVRMDARNHRSILWYNDIFLNMLGYNKEQFEKELHTRCTYMHPDDFKRASSLANNMTKTGENVVFEVRAYTRLKEERIWTVTLCYVSGEDSWDGIPSLYSIGLDITNERKKIEKLQYIAKKDALTGIYNRLEIEKQIKQYLVRNKNQMAALFMIDTDNFKQINDVKGHMIGDMVLAQIAAGMKELMRDSDIVGRIGGDEFIIFMKDIASPKDAEKKAEKLLYIFRHLFENDKNQVNITCSIGIAIYPNDGTSFKVLYGNADKALYQAKHQGKNDYVMYSSKTLYELKENEYGLERTEIESEKKYAESSDNLTRYVFRLLYQSKDVDEAINAVLEIVGKQFDVSRAYVFENSDDAKYTSNTYEWCNNGIHPEKDNLQNCDYQEYGEYEKLFGEDSIFYCRDIHTLKPEQEQLFAGQGIHSTLQCAFWYDNFFSGFVGFDECTGLRLWSKEEVSTLSLIAQVLAIFLQQKKTKKMTQEMQQYQMILNSLHEYAFVIDKDSKELLYANKKFREEYPEYSIGTSCLYNVSSLDRVPILWNQKEAYLFIE